MLMLMPITAPLATKGWDTPTTDSTDSGPMLPLPLATLGLMAMLAPTPMLPLPTPGLLATPPPTPTTMVPTGTLARGPLMLSLRPRLMLMLMLTTAPLATMVWDTPTTDSTDTGPMSPLPTTTVLTAMPPPTPMADTIIEQLILSSETQQSKASRYQL